MKTLTVALILIASFCSYTAAEAQIDTTSYPTERQQIRALMRQRRPSEPIDCSDFIAVGPKGDISFSHKEWLAVQAKEKLVFKSVRALPGHEFIRIYDGTMAVVNFLAEVQLVVDDRDLAIKVRRLEVYHKEPTGWCRVAGQGTEVDEKLFPVKSN
ncbi:hypothetical protein FAES_0387 [Fibrella aestuarina BUZ 2]|uniref:DUF4440 domain-containing protein n=1 Tax=Fibrella aestuarina BUZ 2 TaxID=1166018 RepID=I0K2P6_9BACT|nr:hypothetical protein [Fibrella aestuarina]CCG98399.1 hypothetical protein FAES_0387 [Fibrella aestuarina BUZ 2]